jgi:exodeoxyribonuclease VII small subunit
MPERAGLGAAGAEELPFEAAIDRLEAIVGRLERGELALEEALALFEEGVGLSRRLAEHLERAEQRVAILAEEGGELVSRPLEERDDTA